MIQVSHLTKRYGDHLAVDDLTFTIGDGQVYGFLGPNGAGKSTTMNIMTGCLAATSGDVTVNGHNIFDEPAEAKKNIGYLPELPPLYPDDTPREYLMYVAEAKGIPAAERAKEVSTVMQETQIADVADRLCKNLSKGYRQRVGIAQALIGSPEIIILDEPTVGLDPKQIIEIRDLIGNLGKKHTVILSSHILSEVQAVCTTILIISKGKLVACDTPEGLERLFSGTATIHLMTENTSHTAVGKILENVHGVTWYFENNTASGNCRIRIDCGSRAPKDVCREAFFVFASAGVPLLEMSTERASLEEIFIELTENDSAGPEIPDTKEKEGE